MRRGGYGLGTDFCLKHVGGNADAAFDIVFVHGLTGDPIGTWSVDGSDGDQSFWPKWFSADRSDARVFALGYPAQAFVPWANRQKTEMTLFELAKTALEYLVSENCGKQPLAFICHSLGGILVKQMLRTAKDTSDDGWLAIANSTRLVAFIATPHAGASLASILQKFSAGFSSANVKTLTNDSGHLDELNEAYREAASKSGVRILAYYEKKPFGGVVYVNAKSADPGITGTSPMPLESDHITICKPLNRDALVHRSIYRHVEDVFGQLSTPLTIQTGQVFQIDDYSVQAADRRDLLQKLIDAGREADYQFANEQQNIFAQRYYRLGLHEEAKINDDKLLAEVEQRFNLHVYQSLICKHGTDGEIAASIQTHVIDAICAKYAAMGTVSPTTIMRAMYFLTQQCHLSWNPR